MVDGHMQIGEVAERCGLSLRTIRYYEEVGLVAPSARSQGGFRLYTEADLRRLTVIKRMKPLGLQLEEMRELLELLSREPTELTARERERLRDFQGKADEQCDRLRTRLRTAEEFADTLHDRLSG
ncbi:MerR family transcriptional regulator [Actinopolyspora erythraea]|uniref:MerR family transcriptional regulator n=1 Tax=Actinopolyspora erythraea TaxID=414996 RepID=A0A099DB71_9ACTN|nr:MerR family transcriptional regulator [Actinopolyspora erythraea]ASU77014.1 MerR family transcriptional regulator [Actinopolyspora erythraea]KGI82987.1 MerR family transcriptional regulator [Actinopolyspora erythraea]